VRAKAATPSIRAARGSLTGRWTARADSLPNLRGAITLERDLPAGSKLWLSGWTRTIGGPYGAEYLSISATVAEGRPRKPRRRRVEDADEPEGRFRDVREP
jgi:hypothetical protein